jgi:hypothetical protein
VSVDAALGEVKARGLRLQMLFERPDGLWQASLNTGASRCAAGYGVAADPSAALAQALAPRRVTLKPIVADPAPDIEDLL